MRAKFGTVLALGATAALGIAGLSAKAQAPAAGPDPWTLRQTADSCYLTRSVDGLLGPMDLTIQSFGPETPYHVILRGPGLPLRPERAEIARVGFGGEAAARDVMTLVGKAGETPMAVIAASRNGGGRLFAWRYAYTPNDSVDIATVDPSAEELYIDYAGTGTAPLTLSLGPMSGEYDRLDACARALDEQWRKAAAAGASPVSQPEVLRPNETLWHLEYPANLLLNRISGLVELRVTVDPTGRARDCVVQMATWASRFGEDACHRMEESARFEPARNAQGQPVPALYRAAVMFTIYHW